MLRKNKPRKFNPKFTVVGCFLEYNSKILLLFRQKNKDEGLTWYIPGGKVDSGENIKDSIKREVFEETGIKIDKKDLSYFGKFYVKYPKYDFIYHIFSSKLAKKLKIKINIEEHSKFKWVTPKESLSMNLIKDGDTCIKRFYGI